MIRPARNRGSASVVALLATLAILTVATATWTVAIESAREARTAHGSVQAAAAAEAALRGYSGASAGRGALPLGGSQDLGGFTIAAGVSAQATLQRVGRELYIVRGQGRHVASGSTRSVGYGLWALHPTARLQETGAIVSLAGAVTIGAGGGIRSNSISVPPLGWGPLCAPLLAAIDSVVPAGTLATVKRDTAAAVQLGRFDQAWLAANATSRVPNWLTPAPNAVAGRCVTSDPANWGDPSGSGACAAHRPLVAAAGDLVVSGGVGQGTLIVPGDLTLEAGAHFFGVVLVGGSLRVLGGSGIVGVVRSGSDVFVSQASITGSACPAMLAWSHPSLGQTVAIPGGWLDPF